MKRLQENKSNHFNINENKCTLKPKEIFNLNKPKLQLKIQDKDNNKVGMFINFLPHDILVHFFSFC